MASAIAMILLPLLAVIGVALSNWTVEKHLTEVELTTLPQSIQAYVSIKTFMALLLSGPIFLLMGIAFLIPLGGWVFKRIHSNLKGAAITIIFGVFGILLVLCACFYFFNLLKDFLNHTLRIKFRTPIMTMDEHELVFNGKHYTWASIKDISSYFEPIGKGGGLSYLILQFENNSELSKPDFGCLPLPSVAVGIRLARVIKSLNLKPESSIVIPLEGFSIPITDLVVFAQRYWCKATNRQYRAKSLEALFPQKSSKDFQL